MIEVSVNKHTASIQGAILLRILTTAQFALEGKRAAQTLSQLDVLALEAIPDFIAIAKQDR